MESKIEISPNPPSTVLDMTSLTKDQSVSRFYGNGFQCQLTLTDAALVVKHNEVPLAMISMSLNAVKSLSEQLIRIIGAYQEGTGETISSIDEISKRVQIIQAKK